MRYVIYIFLMLNAACSGTKSFESGLAGDESYEHTVAAMGADILLKQQQIAMNNKYNEQRDKKLPGIIINKNDRSAEILLDGPVMATFIVGAHESMSAELPVGHYELIVIINGNIAGRAMVRCGFSTIKVADLLVSDMDSEYYWYYVVPDDY